MVGEEKPKILRELLQAYGIHTIQDLTTRTGMSPQQGWQLWHGYDPVGLKLAKRLAEALHIPLLDLLTLDPTPPTPPRRVTQTPREDEPS